MNTFTALLDRAGVTCPDDTLADIEVPVLTGPQRQGDVGIWPCQPTASHAGLVTVGRDGVAVVRGETTGGNAHILHADGPVTWCPDSTGDLIALGTLTVPAGSVAWLIHTDEHGVNGIGPGSYRVTGKREQAEEARRIAD